MDGETRDRLCLGVITGAHGVKGEVRIKVFAENAEDIASYGPLTGEDGAERFRIVRSRVSSSGVVAKLKGVNDRAAAERLRGERLYVARDALPETEDEEWYHADLIGLSVETPEGDRIGTVEAIFDFGAGDLIEVRPDGGGKTLLVPFTTEQVPTVDVNGGRIVAMPMEDMDDDAGENEETKEG